MINIAIFASGSGSNAENLFNYYANSTNVKIKLVITNNENAGIVERANRYRKNIQIISKTALTNYTEQLIDFLQTEKVDLIVLAGFLLKVPEALVKAFPNRIIHHPALLPKFGGKGMYGANVHKAVIDTQEKESGITIHFVNEEYDKGEIILQAKCEVNTNDTIESLARKKIHQLEYEFLPKAVDKVIAGL